MMDKTQMSGAQIGQRRPRIDAFQQVSGQVEYCNDLRLPRMLYAKPVFSTEHHARILSIDTSAAERLRGVKAVATAKDAPDNMNGLIIPDQPVYAEDKVRYRGEIVALVAAQDEETAAEAASLIKVEYELLPAVFDPREALEPGAPIIHEFGQGKWCRGNQVLPFGHDSFFLAHGDVDKGMEESDLVVEHTFGTSAQRCAPLEGHAFIAKPEGVDRISIIGNTQMPFWHQPAVAKALRLPLNRVRMVSTPIGGAFGQKNDITIEPNLAVLAMKVGRPVKWAMTTEYPARAKRRATPVAKSPAPLIRAIRLCSTRSAPRLCPGIP
jgi:CO/xanthine dehydrogenase Mo-binding subunit